MKFSIFFVVGLLLLVVFYFFSLQVKRGVFEQLNFDTTVRLQDKIPERFGEVFEDVGFFVSPLPSVGVLAILTVVALVSFKQTYHKKIFFALFIPVCFFLMIGIEIFGKERVESPAPPFFMIKNPTTIFPKYHVTELYSYPSGHASRALFIGGVSMFLFRRSVGKRFGKVVQSLFVVGVIAFILMVSIGKVYLGQHWMSDIVGGWILAGAFLCIVYAVTR